MKLDRIIAVDPGVTTGLAVFNIPQQIVTVGMQLPLWEAVRIVEDQIEYYTDDVILVACEKFTITNATVRKSRQDASIKSNGAMEWFCHKYGQMYEEQMPATAKKRSPDTVLKQMYLYTRGKNHANDAARHLVLAIERKLPTLLDDDTLFGYNGSIKIDTNLMD